MFLKTAALSFAMLFCSRLLGVVRESVLAATVGTSGVADVLVVMLSLPDWITGVLVSGALAYVLLPHWAGLENSQIAITQRRVAKRLLVGGAVLALLLAWGSSAVLPWFANGVTKSMQPNAVQALGWSAWALPAAMLSALWITRLQHGRDFAGMYAANLVVNATVIIALLLTINSSPTLTITAVGAGLLLATLLRLGWVAFRLRRLQTHQKKLVAARPALHEAMKALQTMATQEGEFVQSDLINKTAPATVALPIASVWMWAALSTGLPLALPFVARSLVSASGEGALATFNYAWKLVELPLMLAVQLVAAMAFPTIAKAVAGHEKMALPMRSAFILAWTLACAAAAALLWGAPALAHALFGWGKMHTSAIEQIGVWGATGAWSLLPQALLSVGLTVLAAHQRTRVAACAYAVSLLLLVLVAQRTALDGRQVMVLLNWLLAATAIVVVLVVMRLVPAALPWQDMLVPTSLLVGTMIVKEGLAPTLARGQGVWALALCVLAAVIVLLVSLAASPLLRGALKR